jgi:hypothetical protein
MIALWKIAVGYELAREDRVADTLTLVHLTKTRG